jgi:two-component system sensor histidine kinase KdpD
VRNEVPDDLPYAVADAGLLERVVANLVENAHRHAAGGAVQVCGSAGSGEVCLAVVDHGAGVAEADWERMFEPFQRLGDPTSSAHAGLGLAIARGFTEAMGGTLRPAHTGGGGLTMTLTLPRAPRPQRQPVSLA